MLKVGILGGSFNPVHWGHIKAAEDVRAILNLHEVWFMCASFPPHKKDIASPFHRFTMLKLALKGKPYFFPSDLEIKKRFMFTYDTLTYLNSKFSTKYEFYFLLGLDAFLEISTWKNWRKLFSLANFVIFNRSMGQENLKAILKNYLGLDVQYHLQSDSYVYKDKRIYQVKIKSINISGSEIREMVKKGQDYSTFIPKEVFDYIEANNLYR